MHFTPVIELKRKQLQQELERMARQTRMPELLGELWEERGVGDAAELDSLPRAQRRFILQPGSNDTEGGAGLWLSQSLSYVSWLWKLR